MNVKQKLSILFFLKRKKVTKDGKIPIYVRITIDGLEDEISLSCKVLSEHWDNDRKEVNSADPASEPINKKIRQAKTDIERHFDLMQAKHGLATPTLVKDSYMTPICGEEMRQDRKKNKELDSTLDCLIDKYLKYCGKVEKTYADGKKPSPGRLEQFEDEKDELENEVKALVKHANTIFDAPDHQKTFLLTLNEYLLDFMHLAISGNRSPNTLEKWVGRKKRFQEFLVFRYKATDMPLHQMQFSFIEEFFKYLLVEHHVIKNTAMKYAQCVKDLMYRAVARRWIPANIFVPFKCQYADTDKGWPTTQEMECLIGTEFKNAHLNEIRDIFTAQCFTGYSYAEVRRLGPDHSLSGIDGKTWTSLKRQKTKGDETLPLLPIVLQLIEKYKGHPVCLRRNTFLPVPTCEDYNRNLKTIGEIAGIQVILTTHTGRYYFANEIAYNNGAQLKTVARLLGQKSISSAAKYVKGNRKHISETMADIENILFTKDGKLKSAINSTLQRNLSDQEVGNMEAKIIQMRHG